MRRNGGKNVIYYEKLKIYAEKWCKIEGKQKGQNFF